MGFCPVEKIVEILMISSGYGVWSRTRRGFLNPP